jgi:L-rhamnose mutarotase
METITFTVTINADKQLVWHKMLDQETYREWTKAFHEGSDYEGNWDKGSEIYFTAPGKDGKPEGMYSRIKENISYQFLSIEHLGMISNGVIDTTSEEVKKWTPSFENYTFTAQNGQTELKVDMQTAPEYKAMFDEMWPKALQSLKFLCEKA